MKVTAVVAVSFEVDRFEDGDPSVEVVRAVVAEVAQAIRHRSTANGVSIGTVTASIHDLAGAAPSQIPVSPTP